MSRVLAVLDDVAETAPRPWPATRAALMGEPADGRMTGVAPSDAADRMRRMLRHIADEDAGPVALYGSGGHTLALSAVLADSPVPVVGLLDDDPARRELWGWPIVRPEDADALGASSVIISSWMHQEVLWRRRGILERAGLRVFRLYEHARACEDDLSGRRLQDYASTRPMHGTLIDGRRHAACELRRSDFCAGLGRGGGGRTTARFA
jgi:hypothetical protein